MNQSVKSELPALNRVIALGDEYLAGAGDSKALGWLGRAVAQHNQGEDLTETYLYAVPGESTDKLAKRWEADVDRARYQDPKLNSLNRVVIGLSSADLDAGFSIARSRLNLAHVLDGLDHLKLPTFVVGPAPSKSPERTEALKELSSAFYDVCSRRRIRYVNPVAALWNHEQYLADINRSKRDYPSRIGYGLITWLVLHEGFSDFLRLGEPKYN